MQVGLTPNEVLDMPMDTFCACTEGYADRLFDMQLLGVHQGYWAAYYTNTKKPKPIDRILNLLWKAKNRKSAQTQQSHIDFVDVEAFKAQELRFQQRYKDSTKGR